MRFLVLFLNVKIAHPVGSHYNILFYILWRDMKDDDDDDITITSRLFLCLIAPWHHANLKIKQRNAFKIKTQTPTAFLLRQKIICLFIKWRSFIFKIKHFDCAILIKAAFGGFFSRTRRNKKIMSSKTSC